MQEVQQNYMQVGFMASRKPNGDFMETMPIYAEATPKLDLREQNSLDYIAALEAECFAKYIAALKLVNKEKKKKKGACNVKVDNAE